MIPLHRLGFSQKKVEGILSLWRENAKRFPEKSAAWLVKLTAGQARVDFADVVWVIIEDSRGVISCPRDGDIQTGQRKGE